MGKISNEDRDANALKLVAIWLDRLGGAREKDFLQKDFGWLYYSDIVKEANEFNKRTLSRYLNWLVKEGKLEVKKDGPRTRRFRPTFEHWKKTFKWLRNDNLFEKEELETADAEYLYFIDLASQISEKFDEARQLSVAVERKAANKEAQGLSRKQLNKLNDEIGTLIRGVRLDLSKEYFSPETKPEATYALLRSNVRRALMAYLDLWLFITQTYGARQEYAKQMLSVQRRVAKLKREH
jgi:hypothetical protein